MLRSALLLALALGAAPAAAAPAVAAPAVVLPARQAEAPPIEEGAPLVAIRLRARVGADLQTISGTLVVEGGEGLALVDALSRLPVPEDDRYVQRTFPLATEQGSLRMYPRGRPGEWAFTAVLPRRWGASGAVPGAGLYANGLWHPQPLLRGAVPLIAWEAEVEAPPGHVLVLNDAVGEGALAWSGTAERLALAVVPGGRVQRLRLPEGEVTLVDRGPRRARRDALVLAALSAAWPTPDPARLVVVEAPDLRRLARPGPGVLFLSDRAFRVTDGLWRFHLAAVQRGLLRAGLPVQDPWLRGFVADTLVAARGEGPDARAVLGWLSWIPQIDSLLYDGDLPYYSEVFAELWPDDPVRDDLLELLAPQAPGAVVAHRLDHRFGAGTAITIAGPVLTGIPLDRALEGVGVPRAELDTARAPPPAQELSVDVHRVDAGWQLTVEREAEPEAPPEPVLLEVDGEVQTWLTGRGPDRLDQLLAERPRRVVVDPHGDVLQHPHLDRWPRRWTATVSAFPAELALTRGRISAYADVILRQQYDTRWVYDLGLATDPEDLVRAQLGAIHYRGPLTDRRSRPLRLWAYTSLALLDPAFRATQGLDLALGGQVGAAWETRTDRDQPTRGRRLWTGLDGGVVPATGEAWGALRLGGVGVAPLAGRLALAGRATTGLAVGGVEHRLLVLGGSGGVRGVPVDAVVGEQLAAAGMELRWQVLRGASLPLWLGWLADVQLSGGLDGGLVGAATAELPDGSALSSPSWRAAGWAVGLGGVVDVLGARPTYGGLTIAGAPLSWPAPVARAWPEIYLRMDSAF